MTEPAISMPTTYTELIGYLENLNACTEAKMWVRENKIASLSEAWQRCDRADWLLWLLHRCKLIDQRQLVSFACWCVRETKLASGATVWSLLTDKRSRTAVEVAEKWVRGEATQEEVRAARYAAYAASDAAYAAYDAAYAAYAAAYAAYAAANDAYSNAAAYAANDASNAAAYAASNAASNAATRRSAQKQQADHLRELFPAPFVKEETR